MARRHFFDHVDPSGRGPGERVALFDDREWLVGENIAAGGRTARATCRQWMHSRGHRRNILDRDYRYIGGGYARGGPFRRYYVQVFGWLNVPPPEDVEPTTITLSNIDDAAVLYLNGERVGSAGFGEQATFTLGELSPSDQISVEVYNGGGGYAWSIEATSGGTTVLHDAAGEAGGYGANGNDQAHENQLVHSIRFDREGAVSDSFTVGKRPGF